MNTRWIAGCLLGGTLLLSATLATAQPGAEEPPHSTRFPTQDGSLTVRWGATGFSNTSAAPSFDQLDTLHRGYIDAEQARAYPLLADDFIYADANRDGKLSRAEYERWLRKP